MKARVDASGGKKSLRQRLRYRCSFCRKNLEPVPTGPAGRALRQIGGLGQFYCPHCFEIQVRPVGWLRMAALPVRALALMFMDPRSV